MCDATVAKWTPTSNSVQLAPGRLAVVEAVLTRGGLLLQSAAASEGRCNDVRVLAQLDGSTGAVVEVPLQNRGVSVVAACLLSWCGIRCGCAVLAHLHRVGHYCAVYTGSGV